MPNPMKSLRATFIVIATAVAAMMLPAQTVQFVIVEWNRAVDQKNASGVVDANATPYTFRTSVSGTDGDPVTASTFSSVTLGLTNNTVAPYAINFDSNDDEWRYQSTGYADQASLLSAHPTSGTHTYAMNLNGGTATNANGNISFGFPTIPNLSTSILQAPVVTLSNGSWQGNGTFLVASVSSAITLTFNTVYSSAPDPYDSFHYDVWIGNGANLSGGATSGFINFDPTTNSTAPDTIAQLTIAAGQLVDGDTYTLEIGYEQIMASTSILGDTAYAAALNGIRSKITLVTPLAAVPEPSTYAAWAGIAVLGLAFWRRRR